MKIAEAREASGRLARRICSRRSASATTLQRDALITAELELKYAGYFVRERDQAAKMRRMGQFALDDDIPYAEMQSLSFESRQKLAAIRPSTLAQAARIPGVSPTDLQNLVLEIEKRRRRAAESGLERLA